jgi:hypothetical protein
LIFKFNLRHYTKYVLGERDGVTTLTNFEASSFKKACTAVVQEVDDTLSERTYVAVKERWTDDKVRPTASSCLTCMIYKDKPTFENMISDSLTPDVQT